MVHEVPVAITAFVKLLRSEKFHWERHEKEIFKREASYERVSNDLCKEESDVEAVALDGVTCTYLFSIKMVTVCVCSSANCVMASCMSLSTSDSVLLFEFVMVRLKICCCGQKRQLFGLR